MEVIRLPLLLLLARLLAGLGLMLEYGGGGASVSIPAGTSAFELDFSSMIAIFFNARFLGQTSSRAS